MIQSMTGYGKASLMWRDGKIIAEVKTLNSKALDLASHICPQYREREMELRNMVGKAVERGKVDFNLWTERDDSAPEASLNGQLLASYYRQMLDISSTYGIPRPADAWPMLVRMPDAVRRQEQSLEVTDEEWAAVTETVGKALRQLLDFRTQEGAALEKTFSSKLSRIEALLTEVEPYEKSRATKIRQRITEALESLSPAVNYDQGRLEQEMIYYIEKLDVSEEKQRLANHLHYFRETMATGHGQGKKLGFIAQEMGREINTLGSKSNLAEMQNIVVMMKDELEQIKEQVLNVL